MLSSYSTTKTDDNGTTIRQNGQQSPDPMETSSAPCSAETPNFGTSIGSVDTSAYSSATTNTNNFEMRVTQIKILQGIERSISIESYNQRSRTN